MSIRTIGFGILLASGIFVSRPAIAQVKTHHSYCLVAANHLLVARTMLLQYIGDKPMTHNEKEALRMINVMIRDISDACPGKIIEGEDQPAAKTGQDDATIMGQCIDYLKKAKDDISHEDAQFAGGLRDRSSRNCDEVIRFVQRSKHN